MKIQIESTSKIVQVDTGAGTVPARIWEGTTESGILVHCFVTRIAALKSEDLTQFEVELVEQRIPSADVAAYPKRLIL
jgi:hypothetical protein